MIDIYVDTLALSEEFPMTKRQADELVDYVVKSVAGSFAVNWEEIAVRELASSRQQYVKGILTRDEGSGSAAVILAGWLPNAIESGFPAFDMKEGILNGPKAKTGKNGNRYSTIPFYVGTPTALEENFNGGLMPKEIYKQMKNRDAGVPLEASELKSPFDQRKVHEVQTGPQQWEVYQHKSPIYEGLTKKTDAVTKQNTYMSFRRVSDASDPSAFYHPGIEARHLADRALGQLNKEVEIGQAIDEWLVKSGIA